MPTLTTTVTLDIVARLRASDPSDGAITSHVDEVISLINGTAVGAADKVYYAERTLSGSGNEVLDLAGVLADPGGATLTFAKVKLVLFISDSDEANGDDLEIGPDSSNGWGVGSYVKATANRRVCPAGGIDFWYDPNGLAVSAGTVDELYVEAISGAVDYRVLIVGTSA